MLKRALALAVATTASLGGVTMASAQSSAPECVTVAVGAYQPSGALRTTWVEFCGSGPGADSALHDWAAGQRFVLDGAAGLGDGCGTRAQPCVIFPR